MSYLFLSGDSPLNLCFLTCKTQFKMEPEKYPPAPTACFSRAGSGHWLRSLAVPVPEVSHQPCSVPPTQGMVLSAEYIKKKLEQEMVLSQAFGRDLVSSPCRPMLERK